MDHQDGISLLDYDPRRNQYDYATLARDTWSLQSNEIMPTQSPPVGLPFGRSTAAATLQGETQSYYQTLTDQNHHHLAPQSPTQAMRNWQMAHATGMQNTYGVAIDTTPDFTQQNTYETYGVPFNSSPTDYMHNAIHLNTGLSAPLEANLPLSNVYQNSMAMFDPSQPMPFPTWQEEGMTMSLPRVPEVAPTPAIYAEPSGSETNFEVRSLTSSSSESGWLTIDFAANHNVAGHPMNYGQQLHPRTFSDSSQSEEEQQSQNSWTSSYVDVPHPPFSMNSPGTDSGPDSVDFYSDENRCIETQPASPGTVITTSIVPPIPIRPGTALTRGSTSPMSRRPAAKKMPSSSKTTKLIARRPSSAPKTDSDKRIGKRKGPLNADQRRQAGEIRKLGACLRCRFLKKTCDKGEPCAGCKPSHARLWIVPCTRIDIKDLNYFVKDWKADYERHVTLGMTIGNIKGFSDVETILYVSHGYGHIMPIKAHEVYVRDERCFASEWVEDLGADGEKLSVPTEHRVDTARLSAGQEGIPLSVLSEYLDRHVESTFEQYVDNYYEGTPFTTEILKTAHKYWQRTQEPIIKKALKFVIAYNLTQHTTMVAKMPGQNLIGEIEDEDSRWKGQTAAPIMVNFQIKTAMADMWRSLQKELLSELSSLYSGVYGKDRLKHWPTIFILATILLVVWETMNFDCRYKVPDTAAVEKFCNELETTPVGVVVGLFHAISQKMPTFGEWDTRKHQHSMGENMAACDALTEVRSHLNKYEGYLKRRRDAEYDRNNFDSLANSFVHKLVIRAN
ncbi:hypothetical protein MMC25_007054 [Agyrium rufum]|nr:hypothetical protein [Agyrium rufum]